MQGMSVMNLERNRAILIFGGSSGLRVKTELLHNILHGFNAGSNPERIDLTSQIDPDLVILNISFPIPGDLEIFQTLKSNLEIRHLHFILLDHSSKEIEGLRADADDCILYQFREKSLSLKVENIIQTRKASRQWHAQHTLPQPGQDGTPDGLPERLQNLVLANLSDPELGVYQLAAAIGISVSALYRKLRMRKGITVNEFVKTIRMQESMRLLACGIYLVSEVAAAVGYKDTKHFSKEFRKAFGKTPMEIKRMEH